MSDLTGKGDQVLLASNTVCFVGELKGHWNFLLEDLAMTSTIKTCPLFLTVRCRHQSFCTQRVMVVCVAVCRAGRAMALVALLKDLTKLFGLSWCCNGQHKNQ